MQQKGVKVCSSVFDSKNCFRVMPLCGFPGGFWLLIGGLYCGLVELCGLGCYDIPVVG